MTCMYWTACDWAQRGSFHSPWSWTIQSGYNDNSYGEPCLGTQIRLCVQVCVSLYMLHSQDQSMYFNGKWGHKGYKEILTGLPCHLADWGFRWRLELGWVLVLALRGWGLCPRVLTKAEVQTAGALACWTTRQLDRKERGNNRWTERRGQDRWRVRAPNETFHSRTEMFLNVQCRTQCLSNC